MSEEGKAEADYEAEAHTVEGVRVERMGMDALREDGSEYSGE